MKSSSILTFVAASLAVVGHADPAWAQENTKALIEAGRYVAIAADCAACHTAPDGGKPLAGGYAIKSPMGDIISTNITPSRTHGIGGWSEQQFRKAVREGVAPRGHLYPAMPYPSYARISDKDMHALWVYLNKGVAPVDAEAKQVTALSFPFGQRWLMSGWNMLFAGGEPVDQRQVAPGALARGQYLAQTLGHCGTCHTPRNVMMGEKDGDFLAGGEVGSWHAPNITSDPVAGIGRWSEDELVTYMRDGAVHGKSQAAGPMAEAVSYSLRRLTDADLHAIARYLKTVPARNNHDVTAPSFAVATARPALLGTLDAPIDRTPTAMADGSSEDGQRIYMGACASCHQMNGSGTGDQFYPSLTRNTAVGGHTAANLVMAVLEGVHRETNHGIVAMPAFAQELTDGQVAAVTNYVLGRFGNADLHVTEDEVAVLRAGGEVPLLVRAVPYMLVLAALLVLAAGWWLRSRQKRGNSMA